MAGMFGARGRACTLTRAASATVESVSMEPPRSIAFTVAALPPSMRKGAKVREGARVEEGTGVSVEVKVPRLGKPFNEHDLKKVLAGL